MKRSKLLASIMVVALIATAITGCGGGTSEPPTEETYEPITLRLASDAPLEHLASDLNNAACAEVEERTEGRVKITYYPASQLGGYDTVMEEVMRGTIDMAQTSFAMQVDQRLAAFNTPALTTGWEEAKIVYGPDSYMSNLYRGLCDELNMEFIGWVLEGYMGLGMVKVPTDPLIPGAPKNVQVRVWGSPVAIETLEDLGFTTVTVPYAEVPTAIQTGVVDGWIGGTPNVNYAWVGEIINQFYVNYLYAETSAYYMSKMTLEKLLPEDREILLDVFKGKSIESFEKAEANEENYLNKLQDEYGVEIVRYTEEQIQEQADFVRTNTWPKLVDVLGEEALAGLKAELDGLK